MEEKRIEHEENSSEELSSSFNEETFSDGNNSEISLYSITEFLSDDENMDEDDDNCCILPSLPFQNSLTGEDKCNDRAENSKQTSTVKSSYNGSTWTWQYRDSDGVWVPYGKVGRKSDPTQLPQVTSDEIEEKYLAQYPTWIVIRSDNSRYELNFKELTETNFSSGIDRPIRRYLNQATNEDELPSYWSPMENSDLPIKFFLSPSDKEYKEQAASIWSTLPGCPIKRIYRIQSPNLYRSYINRKKLLQRLNPVIHYEEEYLFHGTDYRNVDSICSRNFDCRWNGAVHGHLYGRGVYFTNGANTAARYSLPRGSPTQQDADRFTVHIIDGKTGEFLSNGYSDHQRLLEISGSQNPNRNFSLQQSTGYSHLHQPPWDILNQKITGICRQPVGYFVPQMMVPKQPVGYSDLQQPVGYVGPQQPVGYFGPQQPVGYLGPQQSSGYHVSQQSTGTSGLLESTRNLVPRQLSGTSVLPQPTGHRVPRHLPCKFDPQQTTGNFVSQLASGTSDHHLPTKNLVSQLSSGTSGHQKPSGNLASQRSFGASCHQPLTRNIVFQQSSRIFGPPQSAWNLVPRKSSGTSGSQQPTGYHAAQQSTRNFGYQRRTGNLIPQQSIWTFDPQQPSGYSAPPKRSSSTTTQQLIPLNIHQLLTGLFLTDMDEPTQQPNAIIIAKVLIGRLCDGHPNLSMPVTDVFGLPTDTAANCRANQDIFVKFNDQEYYPEYYVEF